MSKNQVKELVTNIKSVLDKHNIIFWLDMGTLLGAARDGEMIAWDNDIDFSTFYKGSENLKPVIRDLEGLGYDVQLKEHKILLKRTIFNVDIYLHREKGNFAVNFWGRSSIFWTRLIWKYKHFAHFLYLLKVDFNSLSYKKMANSKKNWDTTRKVIDLIISYIPLKFRSNLVKAFDKITHRFFLVKVPKNFFTNLADINYYGMTFKSPSDLDEYLTCRYGASWKIPNPKWAWPLHMEAELESNFINKKDIKYSVKNIFE